MEKGEGSNKGRREKRRRERRKEETFADCHLQLHRNRMRT